MTTLRKTAEPVAYRVWNRMGGISYRHTKPDDSEYVEWDALYTKREWIGLTEEEINEVLGGNIRDEPSGELRFIRAIESKLKEKNT